MASEKRKSINRALSVDNLLKASFREARFEGEWADLLGEPELAGSWIIWGGSGCGKTNFAMQLAKQLCAFGKVAYNSIEEGLSKSLKMAVLRQNMKEVGGRFLILNKEPMNELIQRLEKRKSHNIIFIDSIQQTQIRLPDYLSLRAQFPRKLFIWISHEDGRDPDGKLAKEVRYDSDIKIRVEGFRAFASSRFESGPYYTIYEKGAREYWSLQRNL